MTVLKFATHLWFDTQAVEAATLYTGLLPDSRIDRIVEAPDRVPHVSAGGAFIVELTLMGQPYIFLNGGPMFPFDSQVSLYVLCDGQAEVDRYWSALTADGGAEVQCGWLTDRFGLSWQIIPRQLEDLMYGGDPAATQRVFDAMMTMVKIDVAALEAAAAG